MFFLPIAKYYLDSNFLNVLKIWSISCLACEKVRVFSGSAGAICVIDSFTQSSGTLTITNASAQSGGVVDLGAPQGLVFGDVVWGCSKGCFPRFHALCLKYLDATKELCIFSAGAISVAFGSFTQSGGNLTITDASSESDGGVVRIRWNALEALRFKKGDFLDLSGNVCNLI